MPKEKIDCPSCDGTGLGMSDFQKCPECKGKGEIIDHDEHEDSDD